MEIAIRGNKGMEKRIKRNEKGKELEVKLVPRNV